MRLVIISQARADVSAIIKYYERAVSREIADEFYQELLQRIDEAAANPRSFAVRQQEMRRVNLHRFPYHFMFRVAGDSVRILVVRHHQRHPSFGISRR